MILLCSGVLSTLAEVDGQVFGQWFLCRFGERLGKTIHNSPFSTLPHPCYGTRQVIEAKFRAFLPCLGDSIAMSTFRAGRRKEIVGSSARFEMVVANGKEIRSLH